MKTTSQLMLWLLMGNAAFAISIEEAFKKGLIAYEISGTEAGHSGNCMSLTVVNNSPAIVNLEVETGRVFEAADTFVQNMIVTKRFFTRLNPKQKVSQRLYAMCAESGDATPNELRKFSHGKMADGLLLSMSKYIEQNNMQNDAGQSLVWLAVGSNTLNISECDYQPAMYASLKKHFALDKNVSFLPCKNEPVPISVATPPKVVRTFKGTFGFSIQQPSDIEISVFDIEGKKVKQLDVVSKMEPDWYNYEYSFNNDGLTKGVTYEVRLIINGKPKRVMYIDN
jgi:hypothetical protein